ncbi:MAG: hypothetical protein ABFE07_08365 [Armatimonadia bacterium]
MRKLVAIHKLTEEQATALVEGPFSEEMREKCELQMLWSEDLAAWVACIWASRGRIGVGVVGDSDPACRVYAIRKAVAEAASSSGMVTEAVYVPDVSGAPDPEDIPEFKRGACECGRYTWHTEDIDTEFPIPGEWYRSWPCDPMPEGTYCSECGSLLGPGGWALLAGRDPKDVQWPKDTPTNREEDH